MLIEKKEKPITETSINNAIFVPTSFDAEEANKSYFLFMDAYSQRFQAGDITQKIRTALCAARKSLPGFEEFEVEILKRGIDPYYISIVVPPGNFEYYELVEFMGQMAKLAAEDDLHNEPEIDLKSLGGLVKMGERLDISRVIRTNSPGTTFGM